MSDTTPFPFDSPSPDDEAGTQPDRRRLFVLITVGVIASVVAGYFLTTLLFGAENQVTSSLAVSGTVPAPVASGAPASPKATPQSVAGTVYRNPFLPLVSAAPAAAASPVSPAPSTTAPGGPSPSATTAGMTTFKVLDVTGNKAVVTIDGKQYKMSVGQKFAKTYKLNSTSGSKCAVFGSSDGTISLCEGSTLIS